MSPLRAAARLALVVGLTAALGVVLLLTVVPATRWRSVCFRMWARGVVRILGASVRVHGSAPAPPFFLVTNHLGYVDVVVLASRLPCFFVAKSEVAGWPVIGWLTRRMNTIFVERERSADVPRVLSRMEEILRAGTGVVFFPEGTSSVGEEILPFRPALFEGPARTGYPLFCASLRYETPPGGPPAGTAVCWWGDMTFLDHLWRLAALPSFEARIAFAARPVEGADRKELASGAQRGVEELFRPTTAEGS